MPHYAKSRAKLAESDAIRIFKLKFVNSSATSVGKMFNVNEKTIRDIWKGRTWEQETLHLDTARQLRQKPENQEDRNALKRRKMKAARSKRVAHKNGTLQNTPIVANVYTTEKASDLGSEETFHLGNPFLMLCDAESNLAENRIVDDLLYDWEQSLHYYGSLCRGVGYGAANHCPIKLYCLDLRKQLGSELLSGPYATL